MPGQRCRLRGDDGLDEMLDEDRFTVDRDPAFDAAQGEQVLHDAVEAVGLGLDVAEQLRLVVAR